MKEKIQNLRAGAIFSTTGIVKLRREGKDKEYTASGDDVSPLVLKEKTDNGYAKCKIANYPTDLWVLVPNDAKVEVK